MGYKQLEQIPVRNRRGKIVPLGELSRKDKLNLTVALMEENNKMRKTLQVLIPSNQNLRKESSYLRGRLREKMSKV